MAVVFVSPLCALSSALFSARVLHHVILIAAVAPLLALAFPLRRCRSPPLAALVATQAVILWLWHMPGPYAWGLASVPAYWLMQLSLLGSAWLLWRAILAPAKPAVRRCCARDDGRADGTSGALIVFAPRPLYVVHFASTAAWGLTPLADQQLAGLLMWVPAPCPISGWDSGWPGPACGQRAGRMTTLLKFVHLGTIAIWSGGLIVLPFLFWQRRALAVGPELDRLHRHDTLRLCRHDLAGRLHRHRQRHRADLPAGHVSEWFSLKMVLVGIMVMLHVVAGLILMHAVRARGPL